MRRRTWPIEDLRRAIDCLPVRTRVAMLEGVRGNEIIAGAYTDRRGGVCPMLAAHRCGGRTDFLSFARAWDRFTRARGRARRATVREVRVLTTHLEASLLTEPEPELDLDRAISEHRASLERSERQEEARRPKRSRPFRRADDMDRALARLLREAERVPDDPGDRELAPV
jgi:hypothetical protein